MNILLDYFFPITAINPTPAASTAFLKQVLIIVAPKGGVDPGEIVECTSMSQVAALTDNEEAEELFAAGMSKVFVLPMDDLDLSEALVGHESDFFTILISSDFDKDDVIANQAQATATITSYANLVSGTADVVTVNGQAFTAQSGAATIGTAFFRAATSNDATAASLALQINEHAATKSVVVATVVGAVVTIKAKNSGSSGNAITLAYTDNDTNVGATVSGATLAGGDGLFAGDFKGVIGVSSDDDSFLADQAIIGSRVGFHADDVNFARNMFFAFGKLLSNALNWLNQQYIEMPYADDVANLGEATSLFEDKISFVIDDSQFSKRLALFAAGGKAIVAPYITKNLQIDMQSAALRYVSGTMPSYTLTDAALLQDELQKVIDLYIVRAWISAGAVDVRLEQDNFVASGYINISEPKALWRIEGEIRQTL